MKKFILFSVAFLFMYISLDAAPAYPYPIKYRQPDGSVIEIMLHGDEFWHYTTSGGKVVKLGADGFYHPAAKPFYNRLKSRRNEISRPGVPVRATGRRSISIGKKKFPVFLVEFSDLKFTVENPAEAFSNMLNQRGYSANGATGSVYDYYFENSSGQFDPTYDVIGPITLSKGFADYGGNDADNNDKDARGAFLEACSLALAKNLVDFSQYDNDGDGYIDNIFFYYAGHNEAEGGSANTIWPHQSNLGNFSANGVQAGSYACTSEYKGSSGTTMAGIGTFCHEFGHALGLPDFYDTDYEKNGSSDAVYSFSLMCNGNYNNNGRTPPYLGALERWILGWVEDLPELEGSQKVSIRPVHENGGCTTPTSVEGEFFLYEVRDGSGWDRYILASNKDTAPSGMLVYHVDMSDDNIISSYPASSLWSNNSLNCYGSHPCYYIVRPTTSYSSYQDLMFPGTSGATSFEGVDWAKQETGYKLSDIAYSDGTATFNLTSFDNRTLSGRVTDSKGRPLQGVQVSVTFDTSSGVAALKSTTRLISPESLRKLAVIQAFTGADGTYSIDIPATSSKNVTVVFFLDYYTTRTETVKMSKARTTVLDVTMYDFSEGEPALLKKYSSPGSSLGFTSSADSWSSTNAVLFSKEELAPYAGYKFTSINYMIAGNKADVVDVFIDFGTKRVFTRTIKPEFNKLHLVDISDAGIVIPENTNVYIGYAVKDITTQYWMTVDSSDSVDGGGMMRSGYQTEGGRDWSDTGYNFIISADIMSSVSPFSSLGIKVISNPGNGKPYTAGTVFNLAFDNPAAGGTAVSTVWYFDGNVTEETSVVLTAGTHTIKAVVTYADGSEEEIEQVILVN